MNELFRRIEELHVKDPVKVDSGESVISRESLYSERMVGKLKQWVQEAGLHLELAARCHHLCRWEIARNEFPEGKTGYFNWRNKVYFHQAELAESLMKEFRVDDEIVNKVLKIIKKEGMKSDHDVQLIEDIACLVFVEDYLEEFSVKYDEKKLVGIIRKTLLKMSDQGRQWLVQSKVPQNIFNLVQKYQLI